MNTPNPKKKNLISQWAFDTRPILGRLHLWLEDIQIEWIRGKIEDELNDCISFTDDRTERMLAMTSAVTALGTRLFGRFGEGRGLDKNALNLVKKDADAISAYTMSESLWYLSRTLPENHAIMVCLGEGLMPKAGETAEMGANPLLGFGRIYARPQVAKFLEECVHQMINNKFYLWEDFKHAIAQKGITVWGAAIDTLENTSRFAKGDETGPMSLFHLFDQPLAITDQYEGYIGTLVLPKAVVETAACDSLLVNYFTDRKKVVTAIRMTYPEIKPGHIHVWTLQGKNREPRIGKLWEEWRSAGAHLVDENWKLPTGFSPFTDSGTYAPTFAVNTWTDDNDDIHLFVVDGYAASAEAMQAASLSTVLDIDVSMAVFSSKFALRYDKDAASMKLNPDAEDFAQQLKEKIFEKDIDDELIETYRQSIYLARNAGIPLEKRTITADDLISEKKWQTLAASGYMLPDPYSGASGVTRISDDTYSVTVRLSTQKADKLITFTLRLLEPFEESKLVFSPLLNRFLKGEDFKNRAVKISDSGRIRNELQTLCSEALEHIEDKMILYFTKIPKATIGQKEQNHLQQILIWYKENYPLWFEWLELKF
ncbi:MAG: hypothetical protein KKE62_01630 [Proteobacteria bacterium]|nr:hypothetical protein [Pseudomonadota bacterium]MBU1387162.1 hypothetical protein [Pseudomonadota bacterium]MBU1541521.1 hypothetical protein [Pseudomonadota bacterium]MBU2480912.1 hypothetical protein [Pseudomonadota bacterium]